MSAGLNSQTRVAVIDHEVRGLRGRSAITGFPEWDADRLAGHLERAGFRVSLRRNGPLGYFRAERGPASA